MGLFKPKPSAKEWSDYPLMEAGAPEPAIFAGQDILIAYRVADPAVAFPNSVGYVNPILASGETCAIIRFKSYVQIRHGYPNDEVLSGHPLYRSGLQPYAIQEIENSPWAAELGKQNEVHPQNSDALWIGYKHWLFAFHDETLEVLSGAEPEISLEVAPSPALAIAAQLQKGA